jgi:hypothetical protein
MRAETKFCPVLNLAKTHSSKVHKSSQPLHFFEMTILLFLIFNRIAVQGCIFFGFLIQAQGVTAALFE